MRGVSQTTKDELLVLLTETAIPSEGLLFDPWEAASSESLLPAMMDDNMDWDREMNNYEQDKRRADGKKRKEEK